MTGQTAVRSMETIANEIKTCPDYFVSLQTTCMGTAHLNMDQLTWKDVAPYSEAVKFHWVQWDSLKLKDGLLYKLWEFLRGMNCVAIVLPK